jgi:carbamoyltransferase
VHGPFDAVVAPYCDERLFESEHEGIRDASRCARFSAAQKEHEETLRAAGVTEFLGHHFSHAAGAFYTSGFSEAIVVTYDGGIVCEPWLATVWRGSAGGLTPIRRITRLDGATAAIRYSAVTSLLGFRPVHDEGKVTGLAARGQASGEIVETLERAFSQVPDPAAYYDGRFGRQFAVIRERYPDVDIAASIQAMTEAAVVSLLGECVPNPGESDCVMSGMSCGSSGQM